MITILELATFQDSSKLRAFEWNMTGPKSASVNVLTNIMSDWEPKTTFGRYFLEIIVQGSEISKAHGVICFWTEPLLYLRCWCFFHEKSFIWDVWCCDSFLSKVPIIANFGGNTTFTTFDNRLSSLNSFLWCGILNNKSFS